MAEAAAAGHGPALARWVRRIAPGTAVTVIVALAATYLSEHYQTPVMLFALLLGMALGPLAADERYAEGVQFSASVLLRISVALLGLRITFADVGALGWQTVGMVAAITPLTVLFGWALARVFRFDSRFGVISSGAVAICGASAAMALAVAWPRKNAERDVVMVIACVATLSTAAMIVYPAVADALGLRALDAGRFLGGSIHDVAQVVAAGHSVSPEAADAATVVKLMRVAMLLPLVFLVAVLSARAGVAEGAAKVTPLPLFLVAFVVLAGLRSFGLAPAWLTEPLADVSTWLLAVSVAALGMKTSIAEIMAVGRPAVALVLVETAFIAGSVLAWIRLVG